MTINKRTKHTYTNQQGQVLLLVVVAVTIALSVGVAVSSRSLYMSSRTTRTDTAQRVLAAAEGGLEKGMVAPQTFLDTLSSNLGLDCSVIGLEPAPGTEAGSKCMATYNDTSGNIDTRAVIDSSTFRYNYDEPSGPQPQQYYWFMLEPDQVKEVELSGYGYGSVRVCWNNTETALYYLSYNQSRQVNRGGLISNNSSHIGNDASSTGFTQVNNSPYPGIFDRCADVSVINSGTPLGLRIKALYEPARVAIVPRGGHNLPVQGYLLTSRGELFQEGQVKTSKVVNVYRSFYYLPAMFDYALYSDTNIDFAVSNP